MQEIIVRGAPFCMLDLTHEGKFSFKDVKSTLKRLVILHYLRNNK